MIDEVHNIVGAGDAEGSMNAANILKPALSRGEIQVIGATTFNEYRKSIEKDTALERRFQPVTVNEPSIEDSVKILQGLAPKYEQYHGVKISEGILRQAVLLSERYITDRFLPDKAIDLIDEACSDLNLKDPDISRRMEIQRELDDYEKERAMLEEQEEKTEQDYARMAELKSRELQLNTELNALLEKGDPQLTMDNLAHVIELWTKIPAAKIREQEFQRLSQLEERLKSHIIGQDEAVTAVAAAVRRNRVGISPKHKPVSFIFVGPTGVGKTELVKQLATDLFNTPDALIRLDMSEFMEKHSVSRIVGSPPGYVGYDEAGQLTEKIRRKPYAVVLFDEIEKAHPDVLNILLQILDDGEITDAHGRKVNFENTIIVMTSNAGSATKEGTVGFDRSVNEQDADRAMKALQQFLRPEFINRVDAVITFNRLTEENFHGIARIMLDELVGSLKEKGITFTYDDALVDFLTQEVLLHDLWRPESAAHHPEGAGGSHGHRDHRQLRAPHHPGEGHGGERRHQAVHPVTGKKGRENHAVPEGYGSPLRLLPAGPADQRPGGGLRQAGHRAGGASLPAFKYDPLKRVPPRPAALETATAERGRFFTVSRVQRPPGNVPRARAVITGRRGDTMEVKRICAAYWSATGNTDKTVNTIAEALAKKLDVPLERRNFTRPSDRAQPLDL